MATVATYMSHVGKGLNFFFNTENLMFAIGRSSAWGTKSGDSDGNSVVDDDNPPYPSLDQAEIEEIIGYKRINNMYFVVPDETSPEPIVDGVRWRKISVNVPSTDATYQGVLTEAVKAANARWIYIDFRLEPTDFVGSTYRQIGLYSGLKIADGVDSTQTKFGADDIVEGSGILECVQNRASIKRQSDQREIVAVVLEF